jgi:hypothetical protein
VHGERSCWRAPNLSGQHDKPGRTVRRCAIHGRDCAARPDHVTGPTGLASTTLYSALNSSTIPPQHSRGQISCRPDSESIKCRRKRSFTFCQCTAFDSAARSG